MYICIPRIKIRERLARLTEIPGGLLQLIRFLVVVEGALSKLSEMPLIGSPYETHDDALSGLRKWPVLGFSNYLIFYIPFEEGIRVVRILHGARDLPRALKESNG